VKKETQRKGRTENWRLEKAIGGGKRRQEQKKAIRSRMSFHGEKGGASRNPTRNYKTITGRFLCTKIT